MKVPSRFELVTGDEAVSGAQIDLHVGKRIRARRMLLGLSQEGLAAQVGVTFQQIQKYERGANRVGASRLFSVARALMVDVGYFFSGLDGALSAPADAAPEPSNETLQRTREVRELTAAFRDIPDQHLRDSVLAIVRSLGKKSL